MSTARHPASTNIEAETCPVNAPSASQHRSCAAIEIAVPRAASTAVVRAVNGGATMMSQCVELATSGASAVKYARPSACVLYIFQFPAITGRRITPLSLPTSFYLPVFSVPDFSASSVLITEKRNTEDTKEKRGSQRNRGYSFNRLFVLFSEPFVHSVLNFF